MVTLEQMVQPGATPPEPAGVALSEEKSREAQIATILRDVELVLVEQQDLVRRLEELSGQDDIKATAERAALEGHMSAHARSLNRNFARLEQLMPPAGPPVDARR